jgi:hypothetical protein
MRWFLSFCLVGLLAYALLPPRTEPLQNVLQEADTGLATSETVAAKAAKRELRSWGSTLRSLKAPVQTAQHIDTQPPLQHRPRSVVRQPEPAVNKADAPAPEAQVIEAVAEPALWARVSFAARAHSEASVSSPVIKFYPAGTELQVIEQQGAWIQLRDPTTSERGWVFNKYLVSIDRPRAAQPALASGDETQATEAVTPDVQMVRDSPEPAAAPKRTVEVTRDVRRPGRWAKRQARRERKLRRIFGRNSRPAAWSLGSR